MKKMLKYLFVITVIIAGCSGSDPENLPEDEVSEIKSNPKKGFCITTSKAAWNKKIIALNVSWHYSWNNELKEDEPVGMEFVPMIWGAGVDTLKTQQKLDYIKKLKDENKVRFMLGFNEPDKTDQANMSVETALAYWPKLAAVGLPLGSPACANPTGDWMKRFMQEVKTRNFRIDFVCVHWYGGVSVSGFLDRLKEIHDLYSLPIWITEFAPADWSATSPANSIFSKAQILTFMKEALPTLDTLSYVQRFAWFSADETSGPLGNAALFDSLNNLTPLGKFYSEFEGKTN